jgi:WD40 repeat protein
VCLLLAAGWQSGRPGHPVPRLAGKVTLDSDDTMTFGQVAFSPDGKTLASGAFHPVVGLWDVKTLRLQTRLRVPFEVWDPVLAFAPDSKSLVTAPGREVLWWDLATGKYRVMTRLQKGIDCLAFIGDGKVLAVGDKEGGVTLWDVTAGKKIGVLWGEECITGLAFSPDRQLLAAGVGTPRVPSYGLVHLWEVAGWRPRATLRGDTNVVTGVDFSPDGKLLVPR